MAISTMSDQPDLFDDMGRDPLNTARIRRNGATPAEIGTGPEGETCKTCKFATYIEHANRYYKCVLMKNSWTAGPGTDIRLKWAACSFWEKVEVKQ